MDKFPNKAEGSNIDSMIEKFRTEINRSKEDLGNRRLTVESPFRINDENSSHGVDQRLTDLESLIKRLQDEISDMSINGGGSVKNDGLEKPSPKSNVKNNKNSNNDSQIYHLSLKDVMKENGHCSTLSNEKSEEIDLEKQLHETFTTIRHNFSLLWDDGQVFEDNIVAKKEEK